MYIISVITINYFPEELFLEVPKWLLSVEKGSDFLYHDDMWDRKHFVETTHQYMPCGRSVDMALDDGILLWGA